MRNTLLTVETVTGLQPPADRPRRRQRLSSASSWSSARRARVRAFSAALSVDLGQSPGRLGARRRAPAARSPRRGGGPPGGVRRRSRPRGPSRSTPRRSRLISSAHRLRELLAIGSLGLRQRHPRRLEHGPIRGHLIGERLRNLARSLNAGRTVFRRRQAKPISHRAAPRSARGLALGEHVSALAAREDAGADQRGHADRRWRARPTRAAAPDRRSPTPLGRRLDAYSRPASDQIAERAARSFGVTVRHRDSLDAPHPATTRTSRTSPRSTIRAGMVAVADETITRTGDRQRAGVIAEDDRHQAVEVRAAERELLAAVEVDTGRRHARQYRRAVLADAISRRWRIVGRRPDVAKLGAHAARLRSSPDHAFISPPVNLPVLVTLPRRAQRNPSVHSRASSSPLASRRSTRRSDTTVQRRYRKPRLDGGRPLQQLPRLLIHAANHPTRRRRPRSRPPPARQSTDR